MIKKEKTLNFLQSSIYPKIPVSLQNLGISIFGLYWFNHRFGGSYESSLKDYRKREFYSKEQWDTYQIVQLRKLQCLSSRNLSHRTRIPQIQRMHADYTEYTDFGI